ncbi:transglycosylase domain-containing protein [Stutzerimonas stutzeri]|jgi:penicillin-binding protein 1A|uniref:transglycosylase domain-containing protein n=1 Tax=Stutzerimonas stutzeri TaxID=316 RepID=UPI00147D714C|nr:transglycosylase domain-containing protein [Stutzerimonas stutzeri]WRQ04521.1 transglycosylase domain-containing protein [Stutzerimonas stutzeri]
MPLRKILRASYKIFTTPIQLLETLIILTNYSPITKDYEKCIKTIKETKPSSAINLQLIETLVIAEDHRNELHYGVDHIAILRTIKLKITQNRTQGASTIEQQLIRTITQRYEKTLRRKIREQLLATMISKRFTKETLCKAYLSVAYYGYKRQGIIGIKEIKQDKPNIKASEIISLLKYPKNAENCEITNKKIHRRAHHIEQLLAQQAQGRMLIFPPNLLLVSLLRRITSFAHAKEKEKEKAR